MVPKHVYETLNPAEQKLWHSHEYEVGSGMLILPKPGNVAKDEWEAAEIEAMKEVSGLYGKTWHFWQVDKGDELPLGEHNSSYFPNLLCPACPIFCTIDTNLCRICP